MRPGCVNAQEQERQSSRRLSWKANLVAPACSFIGNWWFPLLILGLIAWKLPGLLLVIFVALVGVVCWHSRSRWIEPVFWFAFTVIGFALRPWGSASLALYELHPWTTHILMYFLIGCFGYAGFRSREGRDFRLELGTAVMFVLPTLLLLLIMGWPDLNYYASWEPWVRGWDALVSR